jgi:uncharacterized repeat protein (TIGR02543 family)/LPXTG-motif cell wall-anchored protein
VALPADPTRAGYTFNGWFTAQTGGTKYGSIASPPDGNLVVHAQWTQNPPPAPTTSPFAVTYEEHGGTTVPDATFVSGGTVTLPPAPTRAGYTFNGWFTAQTGGTKFGASFAPSDGNVAVHAQWTLNPAPLTVAVSATPPVLPQTGNNVGSLLLAAFALMVLGLYVRARRTELCA